MMMEMIEANWPLFLIALLIGLAAAWLVLRGSRRTRVEIDRRDTLDEGAAPAARNQALIDAPPAAGAASQPVVPITPMGLAGTGTAIASAVEEAQHEAAAHHGAENGAEDGANDGAKDRAKDRAGDEAGGRDDLTRIKGLGPKLAETLNGLGVTRFEQIAGWSEADIDRIDAQLGRFSGRIRRDNWVEQAGYLAKGDLDGFKSRFGAI